MATMPYSGTAVANAAHFASRPSVPGVNPDHTHADPEPDIFNPQPIPPANQAQTVWSGDPSPAGPSNQPNLAQIPVSHWFNGQPAVPSGEPYAHAQMAMQMRMLADHSIVHTVPDGIRLYQHATEGQINEFTVGRMPQWAGETIADGPLAGLQNGKNSYDPTNQPNEVYTGDAANVGRYRLGVKTNIYGLYQSPIGKFGQDAMLHAYTGLTPALPQDKPVMENTAPYTPNSVGTAHWFPAASFQMPSFFSLPSETSITDYTLADEAVNGSGDFVDRTGGFH